MVLKKWGVLLMICTLFATAVVGQELNVERGYYIKRARRVIEKLEAAKTDSTLYGWELINLANLCFENGYSSHGCLVLDRAYRYFDDELKRGATSLTAVAAHVLAQMASLVEFNEPSYAGEMERSYRQAINTLSKVEGGRDDARKYINALVLGARFYAKQGNVSLAEKCYVEALATHKKYKVKVMNARDFHYLSNEVADYYIQHSKIAEAEKILYALPPVQNELLQGVTFNNLANIAICKKEYAKAADLLQQAIAGYCYWKPNLPILLKTTSAPMFMSGLSHTARLYNSVGLKSEAFEMYEEVQNLLQLMLEDYIPYFLDTDRAHLWKVVADCFNEMQAFALKNPRLEGVAAFLFDNNQLKKNAFLCPSEEAAGFETYQKDDYAQYLQKESNALATSKISSSTHHITSVIIEKTKNDMMAVAYGREMRTYAREKQQMKPFERKDWNDIYSLMKPNDAVLDFVELRELPDGRKRYGVIILTKEMWEPKIVRLDLDSRLQYMLNHEDRNKLLANQFWGRMSGHLYNVNTLFISPTGLINTIPFGGIKKDSVYLCEKFDIHYLLKVEDLYRVNAEKGKMREDQSPKNVYLFGGADYGFPVHIMSDVRSQGFGYLPGSKDEVNTISQLVKAPWKTYKYIGKDATENNLRALSHNPDVSVLHISTHGFYLPYDRGIKTPGVNNNGKSGYFDPLMRSGLMLSGANYAWKDSTYDDLHNDGIVTAMDFGHMAFPYTELVVLSACNTGLGEIKDGEGVAGMQQALRMIGVRSMILSLTDVPDKETAELMTAFYSYWQEGYCKSDAFIKAQRDMKDKYPFEPKKWAGFILMQ